MTDREKARDLGNKSADLARSIADVLNDTLDALEAAEAVRDEADRDRASYQARWHEAERAYKAAEAERDRLLKVIAAKDELLVAYRIGSQRKADAALKKLEKLAASASEREEGSNR